MLTYWIIIFYERRAFGFFLSSLPEFHLVSNCAVQFDFTRLRLSTFWKRTADTLRVCAIDYYFQWCGLLFIAWRVIILNTKSWSISLISHNTTIVWVLLDVKKIRRNSWNQKFMYFKTRGNNRRICRSRSIRPWFRAIFYVFKDLKHIK